MDWEPIAIAGAVVLVARRARTARRPPDGEAHAGPRGGDPLPRPAADKVTTVIVSVGILSALLDQSVRAVAGGVIASTAILGLILGLAAQEGRSRTSSPGS